MEHMTQTRHLEDRVREIDLAPAAALTWDAVEESTTGHSATTLVKNRGMRVVLLALEAGSQLKEHKVDADITVLVLRGSVRFRVGEDERQLEKGRLLAVGRELTHDVIALEDTELLLTLSWRR
jgi:quercetin dioxygenase-like cupin family protein